MKNDDRRFSITYNGKTVARGMTMPEILSYVEGYIAFFTDGKINIEITEEVKDDDE